MTKDKDFDLPLYSPSSIVLTRVQLEEAVIYPVEKHAWGQFVYPLQGSVELTVDQYRHIAPPDFGFWLPPDAEHGAWARDRTSYCILNIHGPICGRLPTFPCALAAGPIVKAILQDLFQRKVERPRSEGDVRLMEVVADQLSRASRFDSYLPISDDKALQTVIEVLCRDPGDDRSLEAWARHVNTTERTLARRCQRDLGMTFLKWRQQLRVLRALSLLTEGFSVITISKTLGYSTPSAFIAMFQKATGDTPEALRKRLNQTSTQ